MVYLKLRSGRVRMLITDDPYDPDFRTFWVIGRYPIPRVTVRG